MRFSKLIAIFALTLTTLANAQIGTEFWFSAPDISWRHTRDGKPLKLHVTAVYATTVTISRPADPSFTPVVFSLGAGQTNEVRMDGDVNFNSLAIADIETYSLPRTDGNFVQDKGFLIEAYPGEVSVYYEPEAQNNSDYAALKAHNSLGRNFWVSTQRRFVNHVYTTGVNDTYSGFTVVAAEDCDVTVNPNGNNLEHHGTASFVVSLKKGQSFAIRAASQLAPDHLHGVHVTSTGDVAIMIYDDSMEFITGRAGWDLFLDQTIPVDLVGWEYIVLRGETKKATATNPLRGEAFFITPTTNNTDIYVDGTLVASGLNAGDYFEYVIDNSQLSYHVRATNPDPLATGVYVNHVCGYNNFLSTTDAGELGGAVLPPIDNCTGSYDVTVKRSPTSGFHFGVNLMVRNDTTTGSATRNKAIHNFTYEIDGISQGAIPASHFTYIMDSAFAIYDRYKAGGDAFFLDVADGERLKVINSTSRFHLGTMLGKDTPGNKYGYFSDFAASEASAGIGGFTQPAKRTYCGLDPVQMVAGGGVTYKWESRYLKDSALVDLLDFDTIAAPYFSPDSSGDFNFRVKITGECQSVDSINILVKIRDNNSANFSFSADDGCSPFSPSLTNLSDTLDGDKQLWTIRPAVGSDYQIDQKDTTTTFKLTLPENHTDSIQVHSIELIVKGDDNSCPVSKSKDVKVRPQVDASFTTTDTIGCHPLFVDFVSTSTGNLDTNSYYWDFGDNTQSFDSITDKNYTNYTLYDTTYHVELITESPFGCTDTARRDVLVHPRIRVNVAADTTQSCSPLVSTLSPGATIGADTLWWNIDYFYNDSVYKTTTTDAITLTHYDTSTAAGPDTLYVQLIAGNRMGCMDTATTRRLISYPNVDADFTIDQSVVCDSVPILFTNNSFGYQLNYDWDFGNNTYNQDTTARSYSKVFFNRTNSDTVYTVRLTAVSDYFCQDVMDTNITVHPYIKADFGLNYQNNCSPLLAEITNTSVRTSENYWDFGNGVLERDDDASIFKNFINPYSDKDTTIMVKLRVQNPELCFDSITRPLLLFPQVVADFDFTADSVGCAPLNVGLNNSSTGGNLTYTWDFGDNSSSTTNSLIFNKSFNNVTAIDTTYIVKLTARNLLGCDSSVTRPVEVFAFVDAEFSLPVVDSCSPFTIRPSNLSSAGAHVFNWDFGNGETDTAFEPIVPSYVEQDETVRNYTVELIASGASDPAHLLCADTHKVEITVYPELEAGILMSDTVNCNPLVSTITNNTNLLAGTSFNWYIDDLFYSSSPTPPDLTQTNTTNYDTTHNVILYGRSQYGCRDTAWQSIEIYAGLDAFFSLAPSSICSGDSFQIDQSYTGGGIASREWDFFGEATSSESTNRFYHVFDNAASSSPITKEISLTVYNSQNCTDTWTDTVVVYPLVTADFDIDDNEVCFPYNSEFTNKSINADRANWSFGDGASSIDTDPTYNYNNFSPIKDNVYNVKLTAVSNYNCSDTVTKQITVFAKPDADFYFPVAVACPPFNAQMINNSQGANLTYNWDFSGEGFSSDPNPSHTYSNSTSSIQEHPITLIVTSDKNCADTLIKPVNVYPDVNVDYSYTINEGCSPLEVTFTGDTSNVLQMIWYVNDKAFSTVKDPTYRFVNDTPGDEVFDVKFYAQSLYNCSADTTMQFTAFPSPVAEFIPTPLPAEYGITEDRTPITFNNQTVFQDSWSYEWQYGDGNTDNQSEGLFEYNYGEFFWGENANDNKIPVSLTAWNTNNPECRDSVVRDIIIYPPQPLVDINEDVTGCQPFTVDFSAFTKYIDDTGYEWDFGINGATSNEIAPSYTFDEPGVFMVKLAVTGEGGSNWDYKMITVNPKPIADFSLNDSIVFDSSQTQGYDWINFFNHTTHATEYAWYFDIENDFGGIPDSEVRDPSWHYEEVGEYYVGLIARSGEGCADTTIYPNPIRVLTEGHLTYPTAFLVSPDGPADEYDTRERNKYVFYPLSSGVEEYRLEIYNRWGARIFESRDVKRGWNGYIDGAPAKQDVYIYRARGIFTNGQPYDVSGDVTLIHGRDEAIEN